MTARNAAHEFASRLGRVPHALRPVVDADDGVRRVPALRLGAARARREPIGEFYDDYCHFCYPFNLTGQPAISVPMARGAGGLPLGLQIVGRRFEDDLVLRAAAAWERAQPWEAPSPAPLPRRAAPGELADAAAAGARSATISGVDAWSPAAPVRARGSCSRSPTGAASACLRAWSPQAGELEVSFQVEA